MNWLSHLWSSVFISNVRIFCFDDKNVKVSCSCTPNAFLSIIYTQGNMTHLWSNRPRSNQIVLHVYCFPSSWILEKTLKPVYGRANAFLLLRLHRRPSSVGLVSFSPSQAVLIQLCEMLFLTEPGGTASLQRGLFMGSPGMYIRGFGKGGGIRKGWGGVWSSCWVNIESPRVVFCVCVCVFQYSY